ncbi:hypothetical protein BDN72DRAFT_905317 [Pluteus cervinus]|uniref:Uncharacterized protein n=1 Tax=Pluteus cervinus TaxID=181527 RepID=A0ACD3A426_9AGAR|nr:hypothetical protein BDN72DRAFT_905317 [Pluteus cervinus]
MASNINTIYNIQGAKAALQEEQKWADDDKEYLHSVIKMPSGWENTYTLMHHANPASWRLVKQKKEDDEAEEAEEVIFTLQGVVDGKNLPPILEDPKVPRNKAHFLQQSITLSGLKTTTFEETLTALQEMYTVISRQFPEGRLLPWQPGPTVLGEGGSITLSNRYFTKRSEGQQMQSTPFSTNIDPKKILTRMLTSSLIHTEENEVQYFMRQADLARNFKYSTGNPQNFRIGDIVEVQFSLVVYHMRTEHYILKPMLYSIALLEGKFGNELAKQQLSTTPLAAPTRTLKRKIGYMVTEDENRMRQGEDRPQQKKNKSSVDGDMVSFESTSNGVAKMSLD